METLQIVMLALGFMGAGGVSAFAINDEYTANINALRELSNAKVQAIQEKLAVVHQEQNGNDYSYILSNFGSIPITIDSVVGRNYEQITCNFSEDIQPEQVGYISCTNVMSENIYIITTNHNYIMLK